MKHKKSPLCELCFQKIKQKTTTLSSTYVGIVFKKSSKKSKLYLQSLWELWNNVLSRVDHHCCREGEGGLGPPKLKLEIILIQDKYFFTI